MVAFGIVGGDTRLAGAEGAPQAVPDTSALISGLRCDTPIAIVAHPDYAVDEVVGTDNAAAALAEVTPRVFAGAPDLKFARAAATHESAAFVNEEAFVLLVHWDQGWVPEAFGYCQDVAQAWVVGV